MAFTPFKKKVWLSSPTMHGDELNYMKLAYDTNWMSTLGENLNQIEQLLCEKIGCNCAVPLASGTSALMAEQPLRRDAMHKRGSTA